MSDSPEERTESGTGTMLLGFAIIFAAFAAMFYAGRTVYRHWISPPPSTVALSAYFVDDAGKPVDVTSPSYFNAHIHIQGELLGAGANPPSGSARVDLQAPSLQFQESVSRPLVSGHFEIEDPAFSSIHPGTPATLTAYVQHGSTTDTASINLNTKSSDSNPFFLVIIGISIVYAWAFFYAFSGNQNRFKRQVAITYSYVVIGSSLFLPVAAPYLFFNVFPNTVYSMIGVPVGLVVTCTSSQDNRRERQWAFNIGGYSYIPNAGSSPTPAPAQATLPPLITPGTTETAPQTAALSTEAASAAAPSTTSAPAVTPSAAANCRAPSAASVASAYVPPSMLAQFTQNFTLSPPVVEVEGGLVIPMYVIVLSVLGGAINMTRKVPSFQREDEASNVTAINRVAVLGSAVTDLGAGILNRHRAEATAAQVVAAALPAAADAGADAAQTATPADKARQLDAQIDPLVIQQLQRNTDSNAAISIIQDLVDKMQALYAAADDQNPLPFPSYDEWFASHPRLREILRGNWRVALLNQYMYLISAPFLAIVTYYLLDLVGLSKPGVVVVLSFSVGLISEKIVTWILGVASGYLQTPKPS